MTLLPFCRMCRVSSQTRLKGKVGVKVGQGARSTRRLLHQRAAKIAVTLGGGKGARQPVAREPGRGPLAPITAITCGKDSGARIPSTSCLLSLPDGVLAKG